MLQDSPPLPSQSYRRDQEIFFRAALILELAFSDIREIFQRTKQEQLRVTTVTSVFAFRILDSSR